MIPTETGKSANPIIAWYFDLCKTIKDNWNNIDKIVWDSNTSYLTTSMIIPRWENKNERIISMNSYDKEECEEVLILEKQIWNHLEAWLISHALPYYRYRRR